MIQLKLNATITVIIFTNQIQKITVIMPAFNFDRIRVKASLFLIDSGRGYSIDIITTHNYDVTGRQSGSETHVYGPNRFVPPDMIDHRCLLTLTIDLYGPNPLSVTWIWDRHRSGNSGSILHLRQEVSLTNVYTLILGHGIPFRFLIDLL